MNERGIEGRREGVRRKSYGTVTITSDRGHGGFGKAGC